MSDDERLDERLRAVGAPGVDVEGTLRSIRSRHRSRRWGLAAGATLGLTVLVATIVVAGDGSPDRSPPKEVVPPMEVVRSDRPRDAGDPAAAADAVSATTAFTVALYRQLAGETGGNLVFSPHSAAVALSMTMAGADGETRAQMERVLGLTVPEDAFHDALNALDQILTAPRSAEEQPAVPGQPAPDPEAAGEPLELSITQSLWGQHGQGYRQAFLDRLARSYAAGMRLVDFVAAAERARVDINAWVAEQTEDRITELLPRGTVDDLTRLVLVNTVLFKGSWEVPFDDAVPGPFTTAEGTTVEVPMMPGPRAAGAQGDGWRSATIPYVGGASMVVIVPDDIESFEQDLTPEVVTAAATGTGVVEVTLPRFTTTSDLDLVPSLKALGMTDAFDERRADLSRIAGRPGELVVSHAVQQATITVDEQGTEAAAATAVVVSLVSLPPSLVVDRPFVYLIRDDATGAILFAGRVTDPTR